MNNFTKDDLSIILLSIAGNAYPELKRKIQSLIDNYCEHETCHIDYDHQPVRCKDCKEIVE